MPRNGSSVYSLPAGNPVLPGTVIATTWANTTLTDIATALTNSLSTDGSTASVSLAGKTMSGGTFSSPTVSGQMNLTSGQIAFPAVQVPSAGANVLDDYEEGTWTPTLTFSVVGNLAVSYSTRTGVYTKVGNSIRADFLITTSTFTHTTASGDMSVSGYPVVAANSTIGNTLYGVMLVNNIGTNFGSPVLLLVAATSQVLFAQSGCNRNNIVQISVANHQTGDNVTIYGSITYQV